MRRTWLLAALLALSTPLAAQAQVTDQKAAAAQFKQGREAMGRGDYRRALELFRGSNDLEPGHGKLLNIAICEEKLGLLAPAMQHFEQLRSELPSGDDRRPIVQRYLTLIEPKIGRLHIDLAPAAPRSTVVQLDGTLLPPAALGKDLAVDPGKHVLTVTADDGARRQYDTSVEAGGRATLTVAAGEPLSRGARRGGDGAALRPGEAPRAANGLRLTGFVVGAVGLAGIGVGAVTGGVSLSKHQSADSMCPTHMGCSASVLDLASTGKTLGVVSTVTLVTGVVGAGVGLTLVLLSPAGKPASMGVTALPGGAGWMVKGAF